MESLINYPEITNYIYALTKNTRYQDLEEYAKINYIPIITKETRAFLEVLLTIKKPAKILEVGAAIGYSSMIFADCCDAKITTIEIEEALYNEALTNIKNAGLSDRINLILGDALSVLPKLKDKYDFIFLDAAKGKYIDFYNLSTPLLNKDGMIICDNVLFKGEVVKDIVNVHHKKRSLVRKLDNFLRIILNDENFKTSLIPIGDGVSISVKI